LSCLVITVFIEVSFDLKNAALAAAMVDAAMTPPALPLLLWLLRLRQRQRKNWAGPQFTACVLTFL